MIIIESKRKKPATILKKYPDAGNADGQFCIGLMYANGAGVEQNYAEAEF